MNYEETITECGVQVDRRRVAYFPDPPPGGTMNG
jgi:hypothetical protein